MRRFRAHVLCQAAIVLLNAAIISLLMVPSFWTQVSPKIPLKLGKGNYALATAHAALGSIVECGGLYILVAAGTQLLPQKLRITNYKLWMRGVLVGRPVAGHSHVCALVCPAFVSMVRGGYVEFGGAGSVCF
jgi:hypothetical protein